MSKHLKNMIKFHELQLKKKQNQLKDKELQKSKKF